jgi:hypothetical protein
MEFVENYGVMENVETILEGLLELVRLDMQLRKTGKETAERRQVEGCD